MESTGLTVNLKNLVGEAIKEALGQKTEYVAVNSECPYILIDQYLHAVGVGRNKGLAHLASDEVGLIERIDDKAALKALGLTRGDSAVYVPTDKGDVCLKCAAELPDDLGMGKNSTKLLVSVPDGIDYLSAKVFTKEVRVALYKAAWA